MSNLEEIAKVMEIDILIAVVATGTGLIGGMLIIWRDYLGHRSSKQVDATTQTPSESSPSPTPEKIYAGDQN
jgi:hypothetical protein